MIMIMMMTRSWWWWSDHDDCLWIFRNQTEKLKHLNAWGTYALLYSFQTPNRVGSSSLTYSSGMSSAMIMLSHYKQVLIICWKTHTAIVKLEFGVKSPVAPAAKKHWPETSYHALWTCHCHRRHQHDYNYQRGGRVYLGKKEIFRGQRRWKKVYVYGQKCTIM